MRAQAGITTYMWKPNIAKTEHDARPGGIGRFVIFLTLVLGAAFAVMLLIFTHHTPIIQR